MPARISSISMRAIGCITIALLCVGFLCPAPVMADDDDRNSDKTLIRRGFEIATVPLNLPGKDVGLVGLGSYLVNAVAGCNGCHSAGPWKPIL
jgi:hypothetical protein